MASLKQGYLLTYNVLLTLSWCATCMPTPIVDQILHATTPPLPLLPSFFFPTRTCRFPRLPHLLSSPNSFARAYVLHLAYTAPGKGDAALPTVWQRVEIPLKIAQTAALMEVLHAAFGIVRSPVMITATQVASRLWIVWGIINLAQEGTTTRALILLELPSPLPRIALSLKTLLFAWCVTEVIRYSFLAFKVAGLQPYFLLWLRYSAFIVLYPLGVSSELSMVALAMPQLRASKTWCLEMPNLWNVGFQYWLACWLIVAAYLPGFPQLYGYMLAQRRKVLRGGGRMAFASRPKVQ
jgi:very-long-chain (3R)-3-hydroxyacyl-CoA dehydratase